MGNKVGLGLKFLQWFIRGVQFCCAALVLGVFAYFLAVMNNHNLHISTSIRAVTGISGAAVLYTLIGLLLLWCLAGRIFTSGIAILLDICFAGAFAYVAYANRGGTRSCNGYLDTPFGRGRSNQQVQGDNGFTSLPSYKTTCRLQTACFAVSIIAIGFFLLSILMELALVRNHRKEKRFGPGPKNNYTEGYGAKGAAKPGIMSRLFRRKTNRSVGGSTLPEHTHPDQVRDYRQSYGTERTVVNHAAEPGYVKPETGYGYNNNNNNTALNNDQVAHGVTTNGNTRATHHPEAQVHSAPRTQLGPGLQPSHPGVLPGAEPMHRDYRYNDGVYDRA